MSIKMIKIKFIFDYLMIYLKSLSFHIYNLFIFFPHNIILTYGDTNHEKDGINNKRTN